jgi:nucleolar protein 14
MAGSVESAERELFSEISESVLALHPKDKNHPLPSSLVDKVAKVVGVLSESCNYDTMRAPLRRRGGMKKQQVIQSLAPRIENPEKFSTSKDKGKNASQVAADRTRRELKREKKAMSRELRLDGAFVESESRAEKSKKDGTAKAKRNKAFAWLESEQGTMNQQVAQGGGLLSGGGTGAARAKARSGKIGMKKGGKLCNRFHEVLK